MWLSCVIVISLLSTTANAGSKEVFSVPSKENYPKILDHQSSSQSERPSFSSEKVQSEFIENSTQAIDVLQELKSATLQLDKIQKLVFETQDKNIISRIKEEYQSRMAIGFRFNCSDGTFVPLTSTCNSSNSTPICKDRSDQILACFKDPGSKCLSPGGQSFKRDNSGKCVPLGEDYHEKHKSNLPSKHTTTETNEATLQSEEQLRRYSETISILTKERNEWRNFGICAIIILIIIAAVVLYCKREHLKRIFAGMKRSIQTQISESNRPNSNEVDQSNGETIEMDEIESQNPSRISEPNSSNSTEVAKSNDTFKDSPAMSDASSHSEFSTSTHNSTIPHDNGHPSSCIPLPSDSSTPSPSAISSNVVNQTLQQPGLTCGDDEESATFDAHFKQHRMNSLEDGDKKKFLNNASHMDG